MRDGLGFLLVCFVFVVSLCNAADHDQTFEIVGVADCADCQQNNFKTSQAFSGLHVTIDCKHKIGEIKRVGESVLDEDGKFKISIPKEIIQDGKKLKKECYAQLHNAAAAPCPAHDGLDTTKIVLKSQIQNKITFSPAKTLRFSTSLCTSKFLFEYPSLPKTDPWKKKLPKITIPPPKSFGHPWSLPPPNKPKPKPKLKPKPKSKPLPPSIPIYKPKPEPPVFKPLPPPVPIYKPIPKPPVPIYKPLPPSVPIYKPPGVRPFPPPVPIYEPPVVTKPLPPPFPLFPLPPLYKKPCPPFTKIPPKYFKHPKFGHFPKPPPFHLNP